MSDTQKLTPALSTLLKTLFLLLLLFAIPAVDCSAQTAPPPVDEHVF